VKIIKRDAIPEKKLQALEKFLQENEIEISQHPYNGLTIKICETEFHIYDLDSGNYRDSLPRHFDGERLRFKNED
jgi:hypothetical protein